MSQRATSSRTKVGVRKKARKPIANWDLVFDVDARRLGPFAGEKK